MKQIIYFVLMLMVALELQASELKLNTETCSAADTLAATCGVPPKANTSKLCFGHRHARCFELSGDQFVESGPGGIAGPVKLNAKEQARIKSALSEFKTWMTRELSKAKVSRVSCADVVHFEIGGQSEDLCLSRLPQKEADAKSRELLKTLALPRPGTSASGASSKK